MNITFWIYFVCFKYILFSLEIILKNLTNMKELENMEYIYDKVMFITKFEKLHIHFKTRVGGGTIV